MTTISTGNTWDGYQFAANDTDLVFGAIDNVMDRASVRINIKTEGPSKAANIFDQVVDVFLHAGTTSTDMAIISQFEYKVDRSNYAFYNSSNERSLSWTTALDYRVFRVSFSHRIVIGGVANDPVYITTTYFTDDISNHSVQPCPQTVAERPSSITAFVPPAATTGLSTSQLLGVIAGKESSTVIELEETNQLLTAANTLHTTANTELADANAKLTLVSGGVGLSTSSYTPDPAHGATDIPRNTVDQLQMLNERLRESGGGTPGTSVICKGIERGATTAQPLQIVSDGTKSRLIVHSELTTITPNRVDNSTPAVLTGVTRNTVTIGNDDNENCSILVTPMSATTQYNKTTTVNLGLNTFRVNVSSDVVDTKGWGGEVTFVLSCLTDAFFATPVLSNVAFTGNSSAPLGADTVVQWDQAVTSSNIKPDIAVNSTFGVNAAHVATVRIPATFRYIGVVLSSGSADNTARTVTLHRSYKPDAGAFHAY